jgi:hypothetical protein
MNLRPFPALALLAAACGGGGTFDEEAVHYSAAGSLSPANDSAIIVVGAPGAIDAGGGQLSVVVERTGTIFPGAIDGERGSFAAGASARLGDTLQLHHEDGDLTLVLDVPLASGVLAPSCSGCEAGWSLVGAPAAGLAPVDLASLDDPVPPFAIANVDNGAVVIADSVAAVEIPAVSGGQVCVHRLIGGVPGPSRCEVVP